jgi:hypothetical protein
VKKLTILIMLSVFILIAGCVVSKSSIMNRTCDNLTGWERHDCFYQKALYHALDAEYNDAFANCEKIPSPLTTPSGWVEILYVGENEYYNKCVTNIAVLSLNDSWCSQTKPSSFLNYLLSVAYDYNQEQCLKTVDEERRKINAGKDIWKCILNPRDPSCP